ncbi:radical SAM protein [Candidatus Woesearchaeota archaeon]|nr:radical SAM protein [Candidatus Woesearchaeota archaeon]
MKILFTSAIRPFGVENEFSTKETNYEAMYSNLGRGQSIWVPRGLMNEPATHFIANNINAYSVVLDHPTIEELLKEIKNGFDIVAISFITPYYPRVKIMVQEIKKEFPSQKILIGGYGVNTPGVEKLDVDYICRGEGVDFFKKTFNLSVKKRYANPIINCLDSVKMFGLLPVTFFLNAFYFTTGLGCPFGCEFCATSHFWKKRYNPLLEDGKQVYEDIKKISASQKFPPLFIVNQDDFLRITSRNKETLEQIRKNKDVFFMFCFSSAFSISQYAYDELVELGIDTVFVGIETNFPEDGKDKVFNKAKKINPKTKKEVDIKRLIDELADHGISTVGAFMLNVPQHNKKNIKEDIEKHLKLNVMSSQFSTITPYPGTPFFDKLDKAGKLIYNYKETGFDENDWKYYDGMELVYKKKEYTKEEAKKFLEDCARQEFLIKGPSIIRKLQIELKGYLKYKDSANPILKKKAEIWKKHLSFALPLIYATGKYDDIEITKDVQEKIKSFIKEIENHIRKISIMDIVCAGILHAIILRYKKRFYKEDFVIPQKMKRKVYNNTSLH